MTESSPDALRSWRSIVPLVRSAVDGADAARLDRKLQGAPFTLREMVHHVVEANVVAAGIVTAALGSPGSTFDWSWMLPFGPWMERMRYDRKPIGPALALLEALNEYVAAQVEPLSDGLERRVKLLDKAGDPPREVTVADVLLQEAEHAREHFEAYPRTG